jgi:hypothetical protein
MGEAGGIDLGAAVSVAVLRRGDELGPRVLAATSELAPTGDVGAALRNLATRVAGGPDDLPAVGVCLPAFDLDARNRVEAAARGVFGAPLLVLRPVAAAAGIRRAGGVRPVMQADGEVRGRPTGGMLRGRDPVRDAVDVVALALRSAWSTDGAVAVIGGAGWLAEVAEGITDLTGLPVVVPPDPSLAAAGGAALLAGEEGVDGAAAAGAGVAAGGALLGAAVPSASAPTVTEGAGVGMAIGGGGLAPAVSGEAAGGAVGHLAGSEVGPGEAVGGESGGGAVGGLKVGPSDSGGGAAGRMKVGPGDAGGAAGPGAKARPGVPGAESHDGGGGSSKAPWRRVVAQARKRALVVAPAVVVLVVVGGIGVRSCVVDPETEDVVAAGDQDGGVDADGDGDADGDSAGSRRGSGKDGISEETSTSLDTSTSAPGSTSTTVGRGATATVGAAPEAGGPGPGPGGGDTTTTAPEPEGDRTPPTISSLGGGGNISAPVPGLACRYPTTTSLAARVSDDSGVGSVVAYWSTTRHSGSVKLNPDGQGNHIGTLGPIEDQGPFPLPVAWYVEARDLAGNSARLDASGRSAVTLQACQPIG